MSKLPNFYMCEICKKIVEEIQTSKPPMSCCGKPMTLLVPKTADTGAEKHLPVVKVEGNTVHVNVGSVPHPMSEEHSIQWVYVKTNYGSKRQELDPAKTPEACFALSEGEKVEAVYSYCNLHGLWMTEVK